MNTLRYTTETHRLRPAVGMARVMAAGRVAAERTADQRRIEDNQRRAANYANVVTNELRCEGAVSIGFKICHDSGWKQRAIHPVSSMEAWNLIAATYGMDAEVWGIDADGEFTGTCF